MGGAAALVLVLTACSSGSAAKFAPCNQYPSVTPAPGAEPLGRSIGPAVSLSQALNVGFPVLVPHHHDANANNVQRVEMDADHHAVQMLFSLPPGERAGSRGLRVRVIRLYETRWRPGNIASFESQVRHGPPGTICLGDINGAPAVVVPAKSPQDSDRANAAFVLTKLGGLEVQLWGGDSDDELLAIARTLTTAESH